MGAPTLIGMATKGEQQAFAFLLVVGGLGILARWVGVHRFDRDVARAVHAATPVSTAVWGQRALQAQQRAVDSALEVRHRKANRPTKRPRRDTSGSLLGKALSEGRTASASAGISTDYAKPVIPAVARPVDINSATAAELEGLPRVGPALARRIVERRRSHGPFHSLDDLRHVRGIGPATARLVAPLVTFSGRHSPLHSEGRF